MASVSVGIDIIHHFTPLYPNFESEVNHVASRLSRHAKGYAGGGLPERNLDYASGIAVADVAREYVATAQRKPDYVADLRASSQRRRPSCICATRTSCSALVSFAHETRPAPAMISRRRRGSSVWC